MSIINQFNLPLGITVVKNVFAYGTRYRTIKLSIKQRLFSWPWAPWRNRKVIREKIPQCYYSKEHRLIMAHPVYYDQLKLEIKEFTT